MENCIGLEEEGNSHFFFFKYCNSYLDGRKHMELAFKDLCFTFKRLDLLITSGLTEFSALFGECTYSLY